MAIERRSDGTASVSFMDGEKAGVTGSVGLRLSPLRVKAAISGTAGAQFTAGRTWDFPTAAAAEAFVRRYASGQSLGGEARAARARAVLPVPGLAARPRAAGAAAARPRARSRAALFAEASAALGVQGKAGYPLQPRPVDRRRPRAADRGRADDVVLRRGQVAAPHLGPILSPLAGARSTSSVLEVTFDHGRPVTLAVRAAAAASTAPGSAPPRSAGTSSRTGSAAR